MKIKTVTVTPSGQGGNVHSGSDDQGAVFVETEESMEFQNKHMLDQINDVGFWKSHPTHEDAAKDPNNAMAVSRTRLFTTLSIMDLTKIEPVDASFAVHFRLYCIWKVDLFSLGMGSVSERVQQNGHFSVMTVDEIQQFRSLSAIPSVVVFNAIKSEPTDREDIRVYGGFAENTYVMWNKAYRVTVRQAFVSTS